MLLLFALDRNPQIRTSKALWIPVLWVILVVTTEWWAPVPVDTYNKFVEPNPTERNVFAGLLAIALIVLFQRGRSVRKLLRANVPVVCFFSYCAASVLWSDYPDVAFKRLIRALGDLAIVLIIVTDNNRPAAIERFVARPSFFLIPLSVLLIKYYPQWGQHFNLSEGVSQYSGITNAKNTLGLICLVFGVGTSWRILRLLQDRGRRRRLLAQVAILVMTVWLFWKCNSVTSMSCFVMATILILWTGAPGWARKRVLLHTAVMGFLTVAFVTLFLNVGSDLIMSVGRNTTLTGRTELWNNLRGMNPHPLLGAGFESFWLGDRLTRLWSIMAWQPNEAHNGYIEVYLNLGWLGLALLTVVIVTAYRNAVGLLLSEAKESGLMLAYIVISVAYSYSEAGFRMMGPMWIFLLVATFSVAQRPASQVSVRHRYHWPRAAAFNGTVASN
jgi:O-antigen ligase